MICDKCGAKLDKETPKMQKLDYDLEKEYSHELNEISNTLRQLENGRIYEFTSAKMDGYLATNIQNLRKLFNDLLSKIQNGEDGTTARLAKSLNAISNKENPI